MALDFDIGEYYTSPSNPAYDTILNMSLSAWVNFPGVYFFPGIPTANFLNRDDFVAPINGLYWAINGFGVPLNNLALWGGGAPGPGFMSSDIAVPLSVWAHVATTFDGTTCRHYINGVAATPVGPVTPTIANHVAPLNVATRTDFPGLLGYQGELDDLRMYDRILSAAEIETIFNTRGNDGIIDPQVARFQMREKSPGSTSVATETVVDVSPTQNNADITVGPVTYTEGELRYGRRYR